MAVDIDVMQFNMKKFVNDLGSILQISYDLTLLMMGGKAVRACIDWIFFFFFQLNPIFLGLKNIQSNPIYGIGMAIGQAG